MKTKSFLFVVAGVSLLFTSLLAKPHPVPQQRGTSILHYLARKTMANQGLITNAVGRVEAKRNQQGNADIQRLDIRVAQLETNATYQLLALVGDDTNYAQFGQFNTDRKGTAALRYMQNGSGNGKSNGVRAGKTALPNELDPVNDIRGIAIANSSTQAVLVADLTAPDKFEYLIKRWLSNDGLDTNAVANLRLHANINVVQFRLRGYGLEPGMSYLLAVNGGVWETNVVDAGGTLSFTNLPISPIDVLAIRAIAIWDGASNSVLSTQLP